MRRSLFVVYRPPWWQRAGGIAAIGAVAVAVPVFVVWSTEPVVIDAPRAIARPASRGAPPPASPVQAVVQVQSDATTTAVPSPVEDEPSPPGLSVQVAPGVHVTPIGVPEGGVPMPAGPRAEDSEPEN